MMYSYFICISIFYLNLAYIYQLINSISSTLIKIIKLDFYIYSSLIYISFITRIKKKLKLLFLEKDTLKSKLFVVLFIIMFILLFITVLFIIIPDNFQANNNK